ncbi:MAG TPA: HAD family hydrolase [Vicinamibacteria bacterium]
MRPLAAVLLDWDGTLVDSAETSFRCYVRLFGRFGLEFDRETFRRTYSPNWHRTYAEIGLAAEHWEEADRSWFPIYCEERAELVRGARESLALLRAAGLRLGIVTSGGRPRVEWEIGEHALADRFETVVYGDDARQRKPHPEALLLALDRLGVAPERAAYVGDSPEDVEMARAAGALSVGIPGGFPNQEALRASAPDLLAPDLDAAARALVALCAGRGRP